MEGLLSAGPTPSSLPKYLAHSDLLSSGGANWFKRKYHEFLQAAEYRLEERNRDVGFWKKELEEETAAMKVSFPILSCGQCRGCLSPSSTGRAGDAGGEQEEYGPRPGAD